MKVMMTGHIRHPLPAAGVPPIATGAYIVVIIVLDQLRPR